MVLWARILYWNRVGMLETLYSIVVPVYRSSESLRDLCGRIDKVFKQIEGDYELILVEDCGGDDSWEVMKSLRKENEKIKIIRLARNFGQHNALLCGFSFAGGAYVITMDDDLQNPPEEIPKLIDTITASGFDVVYGIPEARKHSWVRNAGSYVFIRFLSHIFNLIPKLKVSSFRIMKKHVVDQILQIPTPNPLVGTLILKVTTWIGNVPVVHHQRLCGRTNYTPSKLITHFLNGILYHSYLPLKAVFVLGIGCLFLSLLLAAYYLFLFFRGSITVSGWTTLVLLILFFSGMIMFALGIVGEYLFRIIQEVGRAPQYVIRDKEI
jgi:glycosyltransferase involved in cell wall biosynthesis